MWMLDIGLTLFVLNWPFQNLIQGQLNDGFSIEIVFFFLLTTRVGSSENESNELNAQVLSQETASIQLLAQAFSGNIDLNQLMT